MSKQKEAIDLLVVSLDRMVINDEYPHLSLNVRLALEAVDEAFDGDVARLGLRLADGRLNRSVGVPYRALEGSEGGEDGQ